MVDSTNVVSLRGEEISLPGEPRPVVIETLERALEAARSGEIIGVVAVFNHADDGMTGVQAGRLGRGTLGTLEIEKAKLIDWLRSP